MTTKNAEGATSNAQRSTPNARNGRWRPRTQKAWGAWCSNPKTGKYDILAKWSSSTIYCANPKVRVRVVIEADFLLLLRMAKRGGRRP